MIRLTAIIAAILALSGCADADMCGNRIVSRLPSADGRYEAIVFERNCGATTAFSTQVSLVQPGLSPEGAGNLFIASGGTPHPEWDGLEATALWLGPDRLEVRFDGASEVYHEQQYLEGVAVIYRQVPSPS